MKRELIPFYRPSAPTDVPGAARIRQVGPYHAFATRVLIFYVTREILRAKYSQSTRELLSFAGEKRLILSFQNPSYRALTLWILQFFLLHKWLPKRVSHRTKHLCYAKGHYIFKVPDEIGHVIIRYVVRNGSDVSRSQAFE